MKILIVIIFQCLFISSFAQLENEKRSRIVFILNKVCFSPKYSTDNVFALDTLKSKEHTRTFRMNNISISGEQLFQLDIEFKEVAEEHGYYHYCTDKLGNIDSVNYELTVINPINFLELNGESIMKPMLDHNYKVVSVKRKKRMLRRDLIIIVVEYL